MAATGSPQKRWGEGGLAFGADYNPEQWSAGQVEADIALMREARVNMVTLGVFAWAAIEPQPGVFTFAWLDEVIEQLGDAGIAVDLATATASPPPWLTHLHPEVLPVTEEGVRLEFGARQAWCPSSPVFSEHSLRVTSELVGRYGANPTIALWHVSNELGRHVTRCYCDVSANAFRDWLRIRYETIERLNDAWGTAFWSQRYAGWDEIQPPRRAPTWGNPSQQLDFYRFSSHELLKHFLAERELIKGGSDIPVTTNAVIAGRFSEVDYWDWGKWMDVVANDHYLISTEPEPHIELAFSSDLTRGVADGSNWFLMEHSTSAVNWQAHNPAKRRGEMTRNTLQHIGRGADGAMFFQWRASRFGAEKYHSAMVPHAGIDSDVWREVCELGQTIERLAPVAGSNISGDVAFLFDWESWWGSEMESHPSQEIDYIDLQLRLYREFWNRRVQIEMVRPGQALDRFRLVVAPCQYMMDPEERNQLDEYVSSGGTLLVTYWSGIVDRMDQILQGGYLGRLGDVLGIQVEEFAPLHNEDSISLTDGSQADQWGELVRLKGAESVIDFASGDLQGSPAVTVNQRRNGRAWYLATRLSQDTLSKLVDRIVAECSVQGLAPSLPSGVEVIVRSLESDTFYFVINHTDHDVKHPYPGFDMVTSSPVDEESVLGRGGVAVVLTES